nr:PTS system ascorbate-specific transporter subunit IIC [Candidatus Pantoea persica]
MMQFIIKDVLGTPAILVGLFSLIGLLVQKNLCQTLFPAR